MILIGLGSSLTFCGAPPQEVLRLSIKAIGKVTPVDRVSKLYASPAWPDPGDPPFVNAVISIKSELSPDAILATLHRIEAAFGRRRSRKNAPRTLDLDLLAYWRQKRSGAPGPELPHPRLFERDFVLAPLCDIAPDWVDPVSGKTAREMLDALGAVKATPFAG